MPDIIITSFNTGEMTPQADARIDTEKYSSACRIMDNFIPRIHGGAERRPGTKYIADCHTSSVASRVVPFIYSATIAYILEFGEGIIRIYYDGSLIETITSPYEEADLLALQFRQKGDVLWIVHPSYAPRKLSRTSATTFTLDEIVFEKGPFLTRNDIANDNDVTMSAEGYTIATATAGATGAGTFTITSATDISDIFTANKRFYVSDSTSNDGAYTVHESTATTYVGNTLTIYVNETIVDGTDDGQIIVAGGTGTLTASAGTFESGHIDSLFKMTYARVHPFVKGSKSATGVISDDTYIRGHIDIKGDYTFTTQGTYDAVVELQRLEDGENWETLRTHFSDGDPGSNIQLSKTEPSDNVQFRMNVTERNTGTVSGLLSVGSSTQEGIVRITSITSSTEADIEYIKPCPVITATKRWAEGAWSAVQGYPTAVTFFENRVIYAGTASNLQTIWFSAVDDYENFDVGVNDADSFELVIPATNPIRWAESLTALIVGTAGDEWVITSDKLGAALTPTNFSAKQQASYGSNTVPPVRINDVILFVDSVGRKVREMTFRLDVEKYVAPDLTVLAEHITETGITSIAVQRNPDSMLWCTLDDGSLISLTYERDQKVVAWSSHTIGGDGVVESVAVIPSDTEDEIWLTVQRTIDGSTVRYIEQMQSRNVDDREDLFFVDAGIRYDSTATDTFTGLDHLEGEEVQIYGDGAVLASKTVSGGSITTDEEVEVATIGLEYRSTLKPMRIDINTRGGTTRGKNRKISRLILSFFESLGVQYGASLDDLKDIDFRITEEYTTPPGLFTGDKEVVLDGGFDPEDPIFISTNQPLPCTLLSIVAHTEQTG